MLPVVARETFHGGAGAYGVMTAAMGIGAVAGGLVVAGYARTGVRSLVAAAAAFGAVILAAAAAPTLRLEVAALVLVGAASVSFLAVGNSTLQLAAEPAMRGRVMALWAVAFLGSPPLGGPIAGAICESAGPRWGLVLGGAAALSAAAVGALLLARGRRASRGDPAADGAGPATVGGEQPASALSRRLWAPRARSAPEVPRESAAVACAGGGPARPGGSQSGRPAAAPWSGSSAGTACVLTR